MSGVESGHEKKLRVFIPDPFERVRFLSKIAIEYARTVKDFPQVYVPSINDLLGKEVDPVTNEAHNVIRKVMSDRMFVKMADYVLTNQIGTLEYHEHLCGHLEEIRFDYNLEEGVPVQNLSESVNFENAKF